MQLAMLCFKCEKIGHFGSVCRSKSLSRVVTDDFNMETPEDELFLSTLSSSIPQRAMDSRDIDVDRSNQIKFKIDTGADVTAIPEQFFSRVT